MGDSRFTTVPLKPLSEQQCIESISENDQITKIDMISNSYLNRLSYKGYLVNLALQSLSGWVHHITLLLFILRRNFIFTQGSQ